MSIPEVTFLQLAVMKIIGSRTASGAKIRRELDALETRSRSRASFYQLMSRIEQANLARGWYVDSVIDGFTCKERHYELTGHGKRSIGAARDMAAASPAALEKTEASLLLYLETCAVDLSGRVHMDRMNAEDMAIIDRWLASGFVTFGRIRMAHHNKQGTHWVRLSEEAAVTAAFERRARARRGWTNRRYETTTEEVQAPAGELS